MPLLSVYTALPLATALGVVLCPSPTRLAQCLAAALGCLTGTAAGAFLKRAKREAARCAVLRVLATGAGAAEVAVERRRFGVPAKCRVGDDFEDTALCGIYEALLSALLEGPEHAAGDLPALRRLKAVLELDGIVVGVAHKRAAELLAAKAERLEGEAMRRATDKLLFLSERAFADDEPEEAELFEMGRLRKVLHISDREARQRIRAVSRALYQQSLSAVADRVDAVTGEALVGASTAFGLEGTEAARMNAETYREIAADQLKDGRLSAEGQAELEQARAVLQLGDRAATTAFVAVAAPMFRRDVDAMVERLEPAADAAAALEARYQELGLPDSAACAVSREGFTAALRTLYDRACRDARINGDKAALATLDELLRFGRAAGAVVAKLEKEEASTPLSLPADTAAARRLYGLYLERSLDGNGGDPQELAEVLELAQEDEAAVRVEVCQPRLRKLYVDSLDRAQAMPAVLALCKTALATELQKYQLPLEAVEETALEVYKARLAPLGDRVLKAPEKVALDMARNFLGLKESDVRVLHIKSFARTYEVSIEEAMGRGGVMSPDAREALEQLRERLGLAEKDAQQIFYGVVQNRLNKMMGTVKEAWEEATYTKEALLQIWKERGKDMGDDPSADGTGGELGIRDSPPLEGVRGFQLMTELLKVVDFYVGNQVPVQTMKDMPLEYPVTVGKMLEGKVKEEIYGIFAWNAVTCQDGASRDRWERAKPHVGGVLGLSPQEMTKVLVRMVSRWCNMFIKQKMEDRGELSEEDISTLTNWVPSFFGIDKEVTKDMVQAANKGMLVGKAMKLLNKTSVTPADVKELRDEVDSWDLRFKKDLELTGPQLRSFFRIEVTAVLEDPGLSNAQKQESVEASRKAFGLGDEDAAQEMRELLQSRCSGCLVNAVGDLMQGNEDQAVGQMYRLEMLASFAEAASDLELQPDWEVAPGMRQKLVQVYASSAVADGKPPDVRLLENALGVVLAAKSG